jgi:hypothetical protein
MTIDTTKLRELAQKATPGPWEQINHIVFTETGDLEWVVANARSGNSIIDAEYISAANPATVLALLDELERTQGSVAITSAALSAAERELQRLRPIEAAARNLVKVKGRHNSELAMNQLIEACK